MLQPASPSAPYFCLQEVTSRLRTPSKDIISVAVYMTLTTTERERPPDMRRYLFLQKSNFDILCQPLAPGHSTSAPFFFSFFFVIFSSNFTSTLLSSSFFFLFLDHDHDHDDHHHHHHIHISSASQQQKHRVRCFSKTIFSLRRPRVRSMVWVP